MTATVPSRPGDVPGDQPGGAPGHEPGGVPGGVPGSVPGGGSGVPLPQHGPTRRRWVAPLVVGAAGACACAAVAVWNPGDGGTPVCWSQGVLGVDCPFCGGLRAANSLLRGDLAAALDHNVLLAVAMPLLALAWLVWLVRSLQDRPFPDRLRRILHPPTPVLVGLGVLLLGFAVVRNLDGGPAWVTWLHSTAYRG